MNRGKPDSTNLPGSRVSNPELIHPDALIISSRLKGHVEVGEGAWVSNATLEGKIAIGRYTTFNGPNSDIYCRHNPVVIGSFTSIARNVCIQEYDHSIHRCSTYFILHHIFGELEQPETESKGSIVIGNDVWIGTQCVVLSGATIGDGAVIGANSVVSSVIPPYAIAAGSPARVVGFRFPDRIIERLLALQWWKWSVEAIRRNRALFDGDLTEEKLDRVTGPDDQSVVSSTSTH